MILPGRISPRQKLPWSSPPTDRPQFIDAAAALPASCFSHPETMDVLSPDGGETHDVTSPQTGLTYNLRVGITPGGDEVFSGMADPSGRRRIPALGNAQKRLSWTLKGLASDRCCWSVQAIDTAFAGSPRAPEETVTVPWPRQV